MKQFQQYVKSGIALVVVACIVACASFGMSFAQAINLSDLIDPEHPAIEAIEADETTSAEIAWVEQDATRPSVEEWKTSWAPAPHLFYKIDNSDELVALTSDDYEILGWSEPEFSFAVDSSEAVHWNLSLNITTVIDPETGQRVPAFLPTKVKDAKGQEHEIAWAMSIEQKADAALTGGYVVEPIASQVVAAGQPTLVHNVEKAVFSANIEWLDNFNVYETRDSLDASKFTIKRYRYGEEPSSATAVADQTGLVIDQTDPENPIVKLNGLPKFDNNGDLYVYLIEVADMAVSADKGSYVPTFRNDDNYSAMTDALYDNGKLTLTLTNTTTITFGKAWVDNHNSDRPDCDIYLYRIAEGQGATSKEQAQYIDASKIADASPVQGYDNVAVATDKDSFTIVMDPSTQGGMKLPMYDPKGHRYVYFGLETGLTGEYVARVNNENATSQGYTADTISAFNSVKKGSHPKYVLNGGSIENALEANHSVDAAKVIKAHALQNSVAEIQMKLQKKTDNGWTFCTADDLIDPTQVSPYDPDVTVFPELSYDAEGRIVATITGFKAEDPLQKVESPTVDKYDKVTGKANEYRWIETGVKVADKGWVDVVSTGTDTDNVAYQRVDVGEVADGTASKKVTALCEPSFQNGIMFNTLVGDMQLDIKKVWYKNDTDAMTDEEAAAQGLSASASIYKDDEFLKTVTLNSSNNYLYTELLNRYDDEGREIVYTVREGKEGYRARVEVSKSWVNDPRDDHAGQTLAETRATINNYPVGGPYLAFDVEKEYLDESDVLNRQPVNFGIYRTDTGESVYNGVLVSDRQWFDRVYLPVDGTTVIDGVENYVVYETQVGAGNDVVPIAYANSEGAINDPIALAAWIKANQEVASGQSMYDNSRIVGSLSEGAVGRLLEYNYDVLVTRDFIAKDENAQGPAEEGQPNRFASYIVTNRRTATLSIDLTKTWEAGGAETVPSATFEVWRTDFDGTNATLMESFTIPNPQEGEDTSHLTITKSTDAAGNMVCDVMVNGLVKYDELGKQYNYSVKETKVDGRDLPEDGRINVNGDWYTSQLEEGDIHLTGRAGHHTGDVRDWNAVNTRSDAFSLSANKVWRDLGTKNNVIDRPDVSFNVYRIAVSDADYQTLLSEGTAAHLNQANVDKGKVYDYILGHKSQAQLVQGDKLWDTKHNDWYWSCDIGTVARFDAEGNRYIYFLEEKFVTQGSFYQNAYCNTEDAPKAKTDEGKTPQRTKEVFETLDLDAGFAILDDGSNNVYSKTTVNTRVDQRTLSGSKVWSLPHGWKIPLEDMPTIHVDLYRTSDGQSTVTETKYKSENFVFGQDGSVSFAGKDAEGNPLTVALTKANETDLNKKLDNGQSTPYSFGFYVDLQGNVLDRYDEYGHPLNYFVYENTLHDLNNYTFDYEITTNGTMFQITNTYTFVQPWVTVAVDKQYKGKTLRDVTIGPKDLAPAKFQLFGQPTDKNGNKIGEPVSMSTKIVDPADIDADGYVHFVFEKYTDDKAASTAGYENLPYWSPGGGKFVYYVVETYLQYGYETTEKTITYDNITWSAQQGDYFHGYLTKDDGKQIVNTYTGGESISFSGSKTWDDASAIGLDLTGNRPDKVELTISRKWSKASFNGKTMPAGSQVVCTEVVSPDQDGNWNFTTANLDKYAPFGQQYTYYISAEKYIFDSNTRTADVNEALTTLFNEKQIYKGSRVSDAEWKNTLERVKMTVSKTWASDEGETVDQTRINQLVAWGYLPATMTYTLQQRVGNGAWSGVVVNGAPVQHVVNMLNLASNTEGSSWSIEGLPKYFVNFNDATKTEIEYQIVETLDDFVFGSSEGSKTGQIANGSNFAGETATATVTNDGNAKKVAFANTLDMNKITLVKQWSDLDNRDNTRPYSVTYKMVVNGTEETYTIDNFNHYEDSTPMAGHENMGDLDVIIPAWVDVAKLSETYTVTEVKGDDRINAYTTSETVWDGKTCTITNSLVPTRNLVDLEATKKFEGDQSWSEETRPTVEFTLWYKTQKSATSDGVWTKVTEGNKSEVGLAGNPTQTVTITGNEGSVSFNGLYRFWAVPNVGGIPELVEYKVVETMVSDIYTATTVDPVMSASGAYTATITNTLNVGPLKLQKIWKAKDDNGAEITLTEAQIKTLVDSGDIPPELTFKLQYKANNMTNWALYPSEENAYSQTYGYADLANNTKTFVAEVPLKDKAGNDIQYRIVEVTPSGSLVEVETPSGGITYGSALNNECKPNASNDGDKAVIENYVKTGSLSVAKDWRDDSNRDGLRASVDVTLFRDGVEYDKKTLSSPAWSYTWTLLPVAKANGSGDSVWTIKENASGVTNSYVVTYNPASQSADALQLGLVDGTKASGTVTNTHDLITRDISVEKKWNDGEDVLQIRPEYVEVTLKAKVGNSDVDVRRPVAAEPWRSEALTAGELTVSLDQTNSWANVWSGLCKYNPEGQLITYYVEEVNVADHASVTTETTEQNGKIDVTNTPLSSIVLDKKWIGEDAQSHNEVTLNVTSDAGYSQSFKLNASNNWHAVAQNLPVFNSAGAAITYTVVEEAVSGYEVTYFATKAEVAGDLGNQLKLVTNPREANFVASNVPLTTLTGTKTFVDDSTLATLTRPGVKLDLYRLNKDADASVEDNWVKIAEHELAGFSEGTSSYTFTNLPKYWPSADGAANMVRYKIIEVLTSDQGVVALSDSAYTADPATGQQEAAIDGNAFKAEISNTLNTTQVYVDKNWTLDGANLTRADLESLINKNIVPSTLNFQLQQKQAQLGENAWANWGNPITLNTLALAEKHDAGQLYEFANLPQRDKFGQELVWRVVEIAADSAKNRVEYDTASKQVSVNAAAAESDRTATFANKVHTAELLVKKQWNDDGNRDKKRDASITVQLTSNDSTQDVLTATLNEQNSWQVQWTDIPTVNANGETLTWTLTENAPCLNKGYTNAYFIADSETQEIQLADKASVSAKIVNTYQPEVTQMSVSKIWNDGELVQGNRPAAISATLVAKDSSGREIADIYRYDAAQQKSVKIDNATIPLNDANGWTFEWNNLCVNDDAAGAITYSVVEGDTAGYQSSVAAQGTSTVFTNTLLGELSLAKVWKDAGSADRPDSIQMTIKAAGYEKAVELNVANNWSATVSNLPIYQWVNGESVAITYMVEEAVPTNYSVEYAATGTVVETTGQSAKVQLTTGKKASVTATNRLINLPEINLTAQKTFVGDGELAGLAQVTRPSITFDLYYLKRGTSNEWIRVADLDPSVVAETIGYTGSASQPAVFEEGSAVSNLVTFGNLWEYWLDGDKSQGEKIQYKVVEVLNDGSKDAAQFAYTPNMTEYTTQSGLAAGFENTLNTTELKVQKTWTRHGSDTLSADEVKNLVGEGILPASLLIRLECSSNAGAWTLFEPIPVDTTALADGAVKIADLPAKDKNGNSLTWRATEVKSTDQGYVALSGTSEGGIVYGNAATIEGVTGQTGSSATATFSNKLLSGSLTVQKVWGAERVDSVTVDVTSNDGFSDTQVLSAGNDWTYTWNDLRVNKRLSDEPIVYTIVERDVPGYVTYYLESEYDDRSEAKLIADTTVKRSIKNVEESRDENKVDVVAAKKFEADGDFWEKLNTRPTVSFQLQYSEDGENWIDVTSENKAKVGADTGIKTVVIDGDSGFVTWADLKRYWTEDDKAPEGAQPGEGEAGNANPGNGESGTGAESGNDQGSNKDEGIDGQGLNDEENLKNEGTGDLIYYRTVEIMNSSAAPYVSDKEAIDYDPAKTGAYTGVVTNTLQTEMVSLTKEWTVAGETLSAEKVMQLVEDGYLPQAIDFALQYSNTAGGAYATWGAPHTFTTEQLLGVVEVLEVPATDGAGNALTWRFAEVDEQGAVVAGGRILDVTYGQPAAAPLGGTAVATNSVEIGKLEVSKTWVDAEDVTGKRPGAIMVNVAMDGTPYRTAILNAETGWKFVFDDMPVYQEGGVEPHVYTVTEAEVGNTYLPPIYVDCDNVTITAGETHQSFITNALEMTVIAFTKVGLINEKCSTNPTLPVQATAPIKDVVFRLSTQDGSVVIQEAVSDENGVVMFDELPSGTFLLTEVSAPKPYLVSETPWNAVIENGAFVGLFNLDGTPVEKNIIVDERDRGSVVLTKVSEADGTQLLPGCSFDLLRVGPDGKAVLVTSAVTDEFGKLSFDGLLTDVTYQIKETAAAGGYYLSKNAVEFKLAAGEDKAVTVSEFVDGAGTASIAGNEITWRDAPVIVKVTKVDEDGNALPGAKLQITDASGAVIDSWVSDNAAHEMIAQLVAGQTYTLTELEAPEGYEVAKPVTFTVAAQLVEPNQRVVVEVTMVDEATPVDPYNGGFAKTGASTGGLFAAACMMIAAGVGFGAYGFTGRRRLAPKHAGSAPKHAKK